MMTMECIHCVRVFDCFFDSDKKPCLYFQENKDFPDLKKDGEKDESGSKKST